MKSQNFWFSTIVWVFIGWVFMIGVMAFWYFIIKGIIFLVRSIL